MGILGAIGTVANGALNITDAMFTGIGKAGAATVGGVTKGVGKVGLDVTDKIATGAGKTAQFVVGDLNNKNGLYNPIGMAASLATRVAGSMVKRAPAVRHFDAKKGDFVIDKEGGLKLTKLGAGVIFGAGALGSIMDGAHTMAGKNMGQSSAKVYTNTPEITPQQYNTGFVDNGGATGDLVFALHKNR